MKKIYTILTSIILTANVFAQSPEGINYQAVIRDASSNILSNQTVGIQFQLLQGSPTGTAVYTETHTTNTDNFGLVALVLGEGTTGDDFSTIDWANGPYFLEIAADVSGGTTYNVLGTQQLMSVPYALYAKTSGSTTPSNEIIDADNDTKIQVEETADEDIIRFDLAGTEQWKMEGAQLIPVNSGRSVFIGEGAGLNDDLTEHRNVFIGYNTGQANTTGNSNTAIGANALNNNINGNSNTASGLFALNNNIDGNNNTATGASTLESNTSGNENTAVGNISLNANTIGYSNTALGFNVLPFNTIGNNNTSIGKNSMYNNTNGDENVAIGRGALFSNTTGNRNTAIGYNSGTTSSSLNNTTAIGNQAKVATSNSLVLGGTGANAVNVGIGTDSPTELLTLAGTSGTDGILFPDNTLQTTAFTGSTIGDKITDADNNTKIQVEKNANEDIIRFDLAGTERWIMTSTRLEPKNTGNSIFIGEGAGLNDDLSTNQNIFIGRNSGASVTDQVQNTAIGNTTLENLNSGFGNTVYGHETGKFIQTGTNNTIIGRLSGRGSANHTKNNNTFLGAQSGEISEASNNTYLGFQSGQNNVTGTGNLFIGAQSGQNELGSNKLYIDNSNTTSPLIYGEFDNDLLRVNGTLNINNAYSFPTVDGTANQILQTDGAGNISWQTNTGAIQNEIADADNNTKIQVEKNPNEDVIRFDVGGTEAMVVNSNGNVGIGTDAPNQAIEVIGLMRSTNTLGLGGSSTDIGMVGSDAVINLQPSSVGNIEMQINGVSKLTITETGKVGIGVTPGTISSLFTVNGKTNTNSLQITNGAVDGYVLKSDEFGNATWQANTGTIQNLIADADNNTKIQVEETANEDVIRFDIGGTEQMVLSTNANGDGTLSLNPNGTNVFIGAENGQNITTGASNLFIGKFSGNNNTGGGKNVFIGNESGKFNENGNENVFLGKNSGFLNVNGSSNVYLGHEAGYFETGSNKLVIGNNAYSNLIYGEFDNNLVRINGDLEVTGTTKIGSSGTNLNAIIKHSVTFNLPNILSNQTQWVVIPISGAQVGGVVYVSPSTALDNKMIIAQAYVSAANEVRVNFRNVGSSSSNPPNMEYYISIIQ